MFDYKSFSDTLPSKTDPCNPPTIRPISVLETKDEFSSKTFEEGEAITMSLKCLRPPPLIE
jgi:hypothetical protein